MVLAMAATLEGISLDPRPSSLTVRSISMIFGTEPIVNFNCCPSSPSRDWAQPHDEA